MDNGNEQISEKRRKNRTRLFSTNYVTFKVKEQLQENHWKMSERQVKGVFQVQWLSDDPIWEHQLGTSPWSMHQSCHFTY